MNSSDVERHFEETGALLTGHFKLSSGLHSNRYLQCARVLQWPERAEALGTALARALEPFEATTVVSPAMGGLIIGHEVGRGLGTRAIFAERVEGGFVFRRGFQLERADRVVVIEDVVTTGKSTREVLEVIRESGATTVGCGSIVDRRPDGTDELGPDVPFRSLLRLQVPAWEPESCPHCLAGDPLVTPGSRFLAANKG